MKPSTMILRAAVAALFCGHALPARSQVPGTEKPKGEDAIVELAPFAVVGNTSKGYGSTTVTSATRMNTKLVDIPQTITIINDVFLKDIGATELDEALSYAPGVNARNRGGNSSTNIRGFDSVFNYKNGTRIILGTAPDFSNVERIEVIKGPASAIAGRASTGGLVNYITKKPLMKHEQTITTFTVGSDDFKRAQLDYNTPVPGREENMAVRLISQATDSGWWRRGEDIKSFALYPSFLWKITPRTELLVETEFYESTRPNDWGMVYNTLDYKWVPFSFSSSEDVANLVTDHYSGTATISHTFNSFLSVRQVLNMIQVDSDSRFAQTDSINRAAAGNPMFSVGEVYLGRTLRHDIDDYRGVIAQGDILLTYDVAGIGMTNKTLLSYEWATTKTENLRNDATLANLSLSRPIYGIPPTNPRFVANTRTKQEVASYFASHQAGFFNERVMLTAGVRRDKTDGVERFNLATGTRSQDAASAVTHPRYGVVLKPLPNVSVYGVRSDNVEPKATVLRFGALPFDDPRQSTFTVSADTRLREVGVKSEFFNGNLTTTVAYFELKRFGGTISTLFGPAQNDPATAGLTETILRPADSTEGVEIEVVGTLFTPRLTAYGSYQRIDSESLVGNRILEFRGLPRWSASLLLNYDFRERARPGFQVRGGVVLTGDQQGDIDNTFLVASDPRYDFGVSYTRGSWQGTLNVNNITNAIVPTQFAAFRSNSVLPPRQFRLSVERTW
ncbi:MAG: TonB-dependent receptor plug domain-containing protein [Opitutaceae bacterium]|nr:TonB-dependent receptor plug domain-containing protein [Opitutaceae bacterium]